MNILFLLRLWPVYGGGETVTICLANEMVRRGHQVSVAYFKDSVREQMPFVDERVKAVKIDGVDCGEFYDEAHVDEHEAETARKAAVQIIRDVEADVVINQWWPVEFITSIKAECPAVKLIKCHHTTFFKPIFDDPNTVKRIAKQVLKPLYLARKRKRAVNIVSRVLPYVDRYVFLSPAFQREYEAMAHYDNTGGKLDAVPNPSVYAEWAEPDCLTKKEKVVLVVGRMLEGQKKITRVLHAWQLIQQSSAAKGWRLEIVGEGPDLPTYKALAAELGLQRISFEGYRQPLPYYKRARIFLMTSAFEGFSMTLVESQQQGVVPVVMDSFAALHDIVKDGFNGRITVEGDIEQYASAVEELMASDQKRDEMAVNGLQSSRLFAVEKIVDRWERLIGNIVGGGCPKTAKPAGC